jgi:hypothetical protein
MGHTAPSAKRTGETLAEAGTCNEKKKGDAGHGQNLQRFQRTTKGPPLFRDAG